MARIQKGSLAGLVLQAGWKIAFNDDGTITGTCVFKCENTNLEGLLPRKGTEHPKNNKMQAFRAEGTADEAGLGTVTVEYIGLTRDPSDPKIAFMGTLNQESVESHSKFVSDIGGSSDSPKNGAVYDEEGAFKGFPNVSEAQSAKLVGVTGYLRPGVVYRATFFTARPQNFRLDQMGKITSTPRGFPSGVPIPDGANWLVGPSALEPYGNIYKISTDYMLSGKDGWNTTLYSTVSGS